MKLRILYIFFFLLLSTVGRAQTSDFPDPLAHHHAFTATGRDTLIDLGIRFLLPGSVIVQSDSTVLTQGIDFQVAHAQGLVRFHTSLDSGQVVVVAYRSIPIRLQTSYRRWALSDTILQDSTGIIEQAPVIRRPQRRGTVTEYGNELQRSGSIFRGVSVGTNQGMRLQSGLRLQVSGFITKDVEVVGSLTDQSTPIQPEGNTQTLQEIDKVFININAPHLRVTMGDYLFETQGTTFGRYARKLQGAMGTVEGEHGHLTLAAAASKGNFTTQHFSGQEGNQGPYQLTGAQGQREIIVLAGTERVWIDGESMTRGEENDYVIEYGNGQITFTRHRLITEDSRITVDFEYSDQQFQKEVYGAEGAARLWDGRLRFQTTFLREADDKEQPLDLTLTDEDMLVLEQAGDEPDSAVVSGVQDRGEGLGTYVRVDSAGISFYRYVGMGNGNLAVRFSYVGSGKGDYSFQGYGIYRYEGGGRGSYLPIVYLPVATLHQAATFSAEADLGMGMTLASELGVSDRDLNTYSARDDADNVDFAYSGLFQLEERSIGVGGKGLGSLGMTARVHHVGDRFRAVGRMTDVEHGRKWGVAEGTYWGEDVLSLEGVYKPMEKWTLTGESGWFKRGDAFQSQRKRIAMDLARPDLPKIQYNAELIETEEAANTGYWLRQNGSAEAIFWGLKPSLRYQGEHRKTDAPDTSNALRTGFRYDEWTGGLGVTQGAFSGSVSSSIRDDQQYGEAGLARHSLARTDRVQMNFRRGNAFSTSIMFTHRERDYIDPDLKDQRSDLADMKMKISPGRRFFDGNLSYRFSSTQVSEMVTDTIRVGEGLGNYRYDEDLKELLPDPDGDILVRNLQTGTFLPVNDLKLGSEFRLDGGRLWKDKPGFRGVLAAMRSRTLVRVERRDRDRNFVAVNRAAFQPHWGVDSTVVSGLVSFYQDLEYRPRGSSVSFKARFRKDDSESHQHLQQGLVRHMMERSIQAKGNPMKQLGLMFEYQNREEEKNYFTRTGSNRDIALHAMTVEVSYRPKQQMEFALKSRYKFAQDLFPDPATEAQSLFFLPRFSYSFKAKGHLRAELELGQVRVSPDDRTLPYEMLGGDQEGRTVRWTVLFNYRITGHIMATLNYRGRQEPWRDRLYQSGQVEVRAFF